MIRSRLLITNWLGGRDQPAIRSACKIGHGALDVFAILPTERAHLHLKQPRSGLDRTELADTRSRRGFSNDSDTRHIRRNLLEQFEPFRANFVVENSEPGYVTARLRQTGNKAGTDRIGNLRKYDRYCSRG